MEDNIADILRKLRKRRKYVEPRQPNVNINLNISVDKKDDDDKKQQAVPYPSG